MSYAEVLWGEVAPALVAALPNATLAEVPGTHMSSVTKPEFGDALAAFLAPA